MPPGRHKVTPRSLTTGKGATLTVSVGESLVSTLNAQADEIRKKGHKLFIDFNHNEDSGAAGHVRDFFWAGNDGKKGGIRANITWTAQGEEALKGRLFTRFSPQFAADTKTGRIGGLSKANIGGLTNRPAFTDNEEIVTATDKDTDMDPEEIDKLVATAVAQALPGVVNTAIAQAMTAFKASEGTPPFPPKKDEKEGEEGDDDDEEKKALKAELAAFKAKDESQLKDRVDRIVAQATQAGIVAPQDKDAIETFRAQAEAAPDLAERLIPLAGSQAQAFTATVIPEDNTQGNMGTFNAGADNMEIAITEYAATHNVDEETAFNAILAKNPALAR